MGVGEQEEGKESELCLVYKMNKINNNNKKSEPMILHIFRSIQETGCSKHEFPSHFLNNIDTLTMENIASQEEGLSGSLATLPPTSSPVCDHSCTLLLCGSPASSRWLLTYRTHSQTPARFSSKVLLPHLGRV